MASWIYGLDHASHSFDAKDAFGKNIFTNAFPLAVAQYMAIEKKLPVVKIQAAMPNIKNTNTLKTNNKPITEHVLTDWGEIIGCNPQDAYFSFEEVYNGYKEHTRHEPKQSDVVICNKTNIKEHLRPLEIKLVVVPTSGSAKKERGKQTCEIVTRPSTIEQLAFSIADSYGEDGKNLMRTIFLEHMKSPMDFKWDDEVYMQQHIHQVHSAVLEIIRKGIEHQKQTPLVLTTIWRTEGQRPTLDKNAVDVFVWTDLAFLQLFTDSGLISNNKISRSARSLCWLVSSLIDWSMQGTLQFSKHHGKVTFKAQTDKAGAFSGNQTLRHMKSEQFLYPRITRDEVPEILYPEAWDSLTPERRLDAALMFESTRQKYEQRISALTLAQTTNNHPAK